MTVFYKSVYVIARDEKMATVGLLKRGQLFVYPDEPAVWIVLSPNRHSSTPAVMRIDEPATERKESVSTAVWPVAIALAPIETNLKGGFRSISG